MNKLFLASVIAVTFTVPAQAAPTIYGKAFVTTDYVDIDSDYNNAFSNGNNGGLPNSNKDNNLAYRF